MYLLIFLKKRRKPGGQRLMRFAFTWLITIYRNTARTGLFAHLVQQRPPPCWWTHRSYSPKRGWTGRHTTTKQVQCAHVHAVAHPAWNVDRCLLKDGRRDTHREIKITMSNHRFMIKSQSQFRYNCIPPVVTAGKRLAGGNYFTPLRVDVLLPSTAVCAILRTLCAMHPDTCS